MLGLTRRNRRPQAVEMEGHHHRGARQLSLADCALHDSSTGLVQLEVSRFEVDPDFEEDGDGVEADRPEDDNVIPVDFTKKVKLTKNTKTRGVA